MSEVIDRVAVLVECETAPCHPQWNEYSEEDRNASRARVFTETVAELDEGSDKDQVVEQLKPGGLFFRCPGSDCGARVDETSGCAFGGLIGLFRPVAKPALVDRCSAI